MLARHAGTPRVREVTPARRAKLGDAAGRVLLAFVASCGVVAGLLGLGIGVGLFWRAVRLVNGW